MPELLPRTRALLERGIEERLHLGGQLYVTRGGTVVADLAFGEDRPGQALSPEHLMLWLSSTKPVAAVAVAQLWEHGRLELDDRVARHIPEFAQGGKEPITIRHILTHTAGFRMLDVGWPDSSWDEILARICAARLEPRWVPGERAGYHQNSSWFVLGELVRRLDPSHRPFDAYAREEIFLPLGMNDSWIGMPAERFRAYGGRLAAMWDTAVDPPQAHRWDTEPRVTHCAPGSNGWGPIRELGRFYEALLAGGRGGPSPRGAPLVSPQTVEALVARHRTGLVDQTFRKVMDWGLGFIPNPAIYGDPDMPYAYGRHASRRAFGHSGYRSSTAFADPEHGLVVALAVNGTPSDEAHARRFRAILEAIYEDVGLAPAG
jgi:CubicO group peptidase (beta-lactamase class C family)